MYIDDTGDVEDPATNDPKRRYASITGIIIEWDYYHNNFDAAFRSLKHEHFGLTSKGRPPILRRHNLMKCEGPFAVLSDPVRRTAWDEAIYSFYQLARYTVVTSAIDKIAFYYRFPHWTDDVYLMLVQNALERYYFFLRQHNATGDVMAEAMSAPKDRALKARYRHLLTKGFQQHTPANLARRFTSVELKVKPKSDDISGLQMADLLAAISFHICHQRYGNGRGLRGFSERVGKLIETEKFYRSPHNGSPHGFGRVWRPQK
jgi:hypothetical protein